MFSSALINGALGRQSRFDPTEMHFTPLWTKHSFFLCGKCQQSSRRCVDAMVLIVGKSRIFFQGSYASTYGVSIVSLLQQSCEAASNRARLKYRFPAQDRVVSVRLNISQRKNRPSTTREKERNIKSSESIDPAQTSEEAGTLCEICQQPLANTAALLQLTQFSSLVGASNSLY